MAGGRYKAGPAWLPSLMQPKAHLLGALLLEAQQTMAAASLEPEVPRWPGGQDPGLIPRL